MRHSGFIAIGLAVFILLSDHALAKIYSYTDSSGKKVYVDRLSKVPPQYRDQLKSLDEEKDRLDPLTREQQEKERARKRQILKIYTEKQRLREALEKWITPVSIQANRITVPVKLFYGARSKNVSLVLDTGASFSVLHKSAVDSLNAQLVEGGAARVADGRVVKVKKISFDKVEIGPYTLPQMSMRVIDFQGAVSGTQGLLGMDFLLNSNYELDRQRSQIIWDVQQYNQLKAELIKLEVLELQLQQEVAAPKEVPSQK